MTPSGKTKTICVSDNAIPGIENAAEHTDRILLEPAIRERIVVRRLPPHNSTIRSRVACPNKLIVELGRRQRV